MSRMSLKDRPRRIEIDGDILVLDEDFCKEVLAGSCRRSAKRLEAQGLPTIKVGGAIYRPLVAGRKWLADRIERKNVPSKRRRA